MAKRDKKISPNSDSKKKRLKLCLISSSGGHFEQLSMLKKLGEKYDLFWVTESVGYRGNADYFLAQTGLKDLRMPFKMFANCVKTLYFWYKEKPDAVVTTGTMVALPVCFLAKLHRKKVVYIESFARVRDCSRSGKLMYKFADLFIYQWEYLEEFYPNGVYGGSVY